MSKIAEQKALEAYPPNPQQLKMEGEIDFNKWKKEGYIKGYAQAMQDFMEKACEFFYENTHTRQDGTKHFVVSDNQYITQTEFVEQFKQHIEQ